ncbi:hypothetical protein I4U23_022300 [Adineta vaga]|nr:hypothetical protein I4U23_022300 [Adineta vaga]
MNKKNSKRKKQAGRVLEAKHSREEKYWYTRETKLYEQYKRQVEEAQEQARCRQEVVRSSYSKFKDYEEEVEKYQGTSSVSKQLARQSISIVTTSGRVKQADSGVIK